MRTQKTSRDPVVCGSSASHTVSGAGNPLPKVVGRLPQKLRISSRENHSLIRSHYHKV